MALPPKARLFMCHDYKAPGRDAFAWETTVREQRENSVYVKEGVSEDEFVAMRQARDTEPSAPRRLLPSIQVNIRAGKFPPAKQTACDNHDPRETEGRLASLRLDPDQAAAPD